MVAHASSFQTIATPTLPFNPIFNAPAVKGKLVTALSQNEGSSSSSSVYEFIHSMILQKPEMDSPFVVLDLGVVVGLMENWTTKLPTVQPYYAVKCNPNLSLLGTLAALGSRFDCASKAEIETVLSLGVTPDRIVYANPCKSESHIKYAATVGVNVTTFDSKEEIQKIKKWHPKCDLLIRIKPPQDSGARVPLGLKYGALEEEIPDLLESAHNSGLNVIGVSFHIGSGGGDSRAYYEAIAAAKTVFEAASNLGMARMKVLDIGGGFSSGAQFDDAAFHVNEGLRKYFRNEEGIMVIGEPGRYFAESAFTLASKVIGKRVRGEVREYWINDGIYGSMNCILYDSQSVTCGPLACSSKPEDPRCREVKTYPSTVFGPTCDSLDTVLRDYLLPELQVNDWLVFPNMGAYTTASGSNFNGFSTSDISTYLAYSTPVVGDLQTMF